jgi:hypothetical protein
MNPMSAFKVLLWLAPVLAVLFFYITQQQKAQVDDMKVEFSKFDEDFAAMSGGLSHGNEKKHWEAAGAEAHERHKEAKVKAAISNKKEEDAFAQMEKELANTDSDKLIEANK